MKFSLISFFLSSIREGVSFRLEVEAQARLQRRQVRPDLFHFFSL